MKTIHLKSQDGRAYRTTDPVEAAHLRNTRGYTVTTTTETDTKADEAPKNKAATAADNK